MTNSILTKHVIAPSDGNLSGSCTLSKPLVHPRGGKQKLPGEIRNIYNNQVSIAIVYLKNVTKHL